MEKVIYMASTCDEHYMNQLKVALYTLNHNGGHWPIVLDLTEDRWGELTKINPDIEEINVLPFVGEYVDYTYFRLNRFDEILKEHKFILSMDTDIIIRKSIKHIWDDMEPGVLKVWDRGKKKAGRYRFQGGVVLYGSSRMIRNYYSDCLDRMVKDKKKDGGQAALFALWKHKYKNIIDLVSLDRTYNNIKLNDSAHIWHCKHNHFNEKKYQDEFQHYLKKANKCTL